MTVLASLIAYQKKLLRQSSTSPLASQLSYMRWNPVCHQEEKFRLLYSLTRSYDILSWLGHFLCLYGSWSIIPSWEFRPQTAKGLS